MALTKYFSILRLFVMVLSCNKNEEEFVCDTDDDSPAINCNGVNADTSVNGFKVNYYPGGTIKKSEGNYNSGIQNGFWKFYSQSGSLSMEGNYTSGKVYGFWKLFFANGSLNEEGNYKNCIRHGFWKFYYNNSSNSVRKEGHYTNGSKSGNWVYYNSDGSILKQGSC